MNKMQLENLGSIGGVLIFMGIGILIDKLLIVCLMTFLAYMLATQLQMNKYIKSIKKESMEVKEW